MSALICKSILSAVKQPILLQGCVCNEAVRWASKKAGGSSRNKKGRTPGKHRGWKKLDGDYVEKGMVLYKQLGLQVYPGENVAMGRDLTLFSLEAGNVMVTREQLSPYPTSALYPAVKDGRVLFREFYHVLPEKQTGRFKLVSQT